MSYTGEFDTWGLEDQLNSGELAYGYGSNDSGGYDFQFGDLNPGQQSGWNFQDLFSQNNSSWDSYGGFDSQSWPQATTNYDYPDFSNTPFNTQQTPNWFADTQTMAPTNFDQPQVDPSSWNPVEQPMLEQFSGYNTDPNELNQLQGLGDVTRDIRGGDTTPEGSGGLMEMLNGLGSGLTGLLGRGSPLLPLLFLGSGLMSNNAAGNTSRTLQELAQTEQARNQTAIDKLNQFIASGEGRPDPANYGSGSSMNFNSGNSEYLSKLQAAIDDPRYGLKDWMDAEGGRRAEAAARKMAKSGRTGLAPMTSLEAMRDYLSSGRKEKIGEMQGLAGLYNQRDIASMNAAASSASANASANASKYNADMGYYRDVMSTLEKQADPSNYINLLLAGTQAQGQQYNPLLNAIAAFMGRN